MRCYARLIRASGLALLLLSTIVSASVSYARPTLTPPSAAGAQEAALADDGGTLRLPPHAPPAPLAYGDFQRFGLTVSPTQQFSALFQSLRIDYDADVPDGSSVLVDLRASADGVRWTRWETDLASGAVAAFGAPARFAQYRVILLGGARSGPSVRALRLTPQAAPAIYRAQSASEMPVAPTYRIRGTRMGMVGGRTANGHRITKRDHFVSLPSRRSLSSRGGSEYMVRITYKGRSSVAPVYDVGPWNIHDNYWDEQRDRFKDLERGWPEDHAAYYDGYNKGMAEKGRVRFPTAIDVGDGVWWDDLGIKGDQAEVEVTFLWLGRDPLAEPPAPEQSTAAEPPAPSAPGEVLVDNADPAFKAQPATWYSAQGCGHAGQSVWTYTTPNPNKSENVARWQPALASEGLYDVYAHVPACRAGRANTTSARYAVHHRDGVQEVVVEQVAGAWVHLGRFPFAAGEGGFVELRDVADDSMRVLWYDALKWLPAT